MHSASSSVSILDIGAGNIRSVVRAVEKAGASTEVINNTEAILQSQKLILPGVGHFGQAMNKIQELGLKQALQNAAFERQIPILGICLGMQLMCTFSEEGNTEGLGWFDARVTRMRVTDRLRYKIPHTGWNELEFHAGHPLLKGLQPRDECYFVHAYHVASAPEEQVLCRTTHETPFVSGMQRGNLFGMQFHPEKSHATGAQIFRNFIKI